MRRSLDMALAKEVAHAMTALEARGAIRATNRGSLKLPMQGLAGSTCLGLQLLGGGIVTLIATALAPQEWVAYCSEGGPATPAPMRSARRRKANRESPTSGAFRMIRMLKGLWRPSAAALLRASCRSGCVKRRNLPSCIRMDARSWQICPKGPRPCGQ